MGPELMAPAMFLFLLLAIFSGYPVAFSIAGVGLFFGIISAAFDVVSWSFFYALPGRIYGIMSNSVLLAVPFFIFMGNMLEKSRLAEDLLKTVGLLFGPVRGGLALAVVLVGTLLAAATGVVGASVVAMGMISLPIMLRYKYSHSFAAGTIAASGTLGQIIPPSVVLVVLADQVGISVKDLFVGAAVPGLILAGLFMVYVFFKALSDPQSAPALPPEERRIKTSELVKRTLFVMLPPLLLIVIVLGSIFMGIATPTDAGALGAVGTMVLAALNGRFNKKNLKDSAEDTARLTVMALFLLIGSTLFALVFRGVNGDLWIQDFLSLLPGGKIGFLIVAHLIVFVLGFFIDFFEIIFIIIPLLIPAARALGIDLVWFSILIAMNLQTSFLTPPFGVSLFYLRGVAPEHVKTTEIYKGVIPFILIQVFTLILIMAFPSLVTES